MICHQMRDNVCKSSAPDRGLVLSCIEDQRFININVNNRASCYWHSIFAHACALIGYDLPQRYTKWRSKCVSVFAQCDAGAIYEECPNSCLSTCSSSKNEYGFNSICRQHCVAGRIYLE